jgi:hypothetical protein
MFGPPWPPDLSAYRYKSNLATWINEHARHGQRYTHYEQAAEMLQRATTIERFKLTATNYLTWLELGGPDMQLGDKYTLNKLASVLESNSTKSPAMDLYTPQDLQAPSSLQTESQETHHKQLTTSSMEDKGKTWAPSHLQMQTDVLSQR